ncbi:histidinol phosphate phosphatase HisJ family protein [Lasiosphaeria miniovina]|uniref:Histidinol-phosphatase n=1 Tax=Lasiosphaeria miniovina TaxID=1954250 RepID=A0AA39ZQV8_9PEZI|nr:histidinol phosphate phosphatase HisJ family protein [Lasiosphaeria miniovina]KAK0701775.1 histidinol phosphate phosphatase HisJ family protein [Lasiosphaeria miniovina]
MAFTMHSHSGQFCPGHAKDQLEDIVQHAIRIGYKTMGLTEHMPRTELSDLYPEELESDPHASLAELAPRHSSYLVEAQRLQKKYADQIHILIGIEGEWIRPAYGDIVKAHTEPACIDYFLGSVHHTAGVPIDFDKVHYARARDAAGGSEELLYEKYYDEQLEMLRTLKPRVVAHFDLIRLLSDEPARPLQAWAGGRVWDKVVRNLEFVASYGGWLECNTSALRKGLDEPYPARPIAEEWLRAGGKFTFSDDSHGIAQVATNYARGLDYLESLGVKEVWTLERAPHPGTSGEVKAALTKKSVPIAEFRASLRLE